MLSLSCKQHIHEKLIRFDYKLFLAATPNEYLIYFSSYHELKSVLLLEQTRLWLGASFLFCLSRQTCQKYRFFISLLLLDKLMEQAQLEKT